MPRNEFKAFAIADDTNIVNQNEWENSEALKGGFKKGLARSIEINKAIRQSSSIAAAIAEFTAEKSGKDVLDNGDISILKNSFELALKNVSSNCIGGAEGEADTITAETEPAIKQLVHGQLVHIRAKYKNQTGTPTLKINQTLAKTIVKGNNLTLEEGDIAGSGHWLEMQYDEALDKWVLQNPAKGITPSSGVPVGTIEYFAAAIPPAGYLKADGSEVGRETYPDLFDVIGTTFGEGDGLTTFKLPDLIDRFAQGSNTPGMKVEAGLPNITGFLSASELGNVGSEFGNTPIWSGCIQVGAKNDANPIVINRAVVTVDMAGVNVVNDARIDASHSNPIYGASDIVQPPALTLLPCIKAFDAVSNPGLIDITELARQVNYMNGIILFPVPAGGLHLYISPSGNDANNGKSAEKAYASLERALKETQKYVRNSAETIVIHVAAGMYDTIESNGFFLVDMSVYYPRIRIEGEGNASVFSASIYVNNFGTLHLKNLRIIVTDRQHPCVVSMDGGVMLIEDCRLEGYNTGNALMKSSYGRLKAVSNIWLGGSGIFSAVRVANMGFADIHQATLNLITNPTFNLSTVSIDAGGYLYAHGSVWTGTSVGKKYQVDCNGICYTLSGNNFFPGTVAGEVAHGGQYV